MDETLSADQFLQKKSDYSRFLVHLTRSEELDPSEPPLRIPAKDVLETILSEKTLKAFNHYCYFSEALKKEDKGVQDRFNVVCFTETPIHQVEALLNRVSGRQFMPEPYGLVFEKDYIRQQGGNPVFYVTKKIARPLWQPLYLRQVAATQQPPDDTCRLLALVTLCETGNDWHWEREWRIVGDLSFSLKDVYCGLCPEEHIANFEKKYRPIKFISPKWALDTILAKAIGK
ncbi:MAG: hypothetical protein HYX85_01605 [Chloroflexi bacterium]|nr:hypothetical protein [Chloroflexota bacterium]